MKSYYKTKLFSIIIIIIIIISLTNLFLRWNDPHPPECWDSTTIIEDEILYDSIIDNNQADKIIGYTIIAESEEFAPVPEFSLGTLIVLASSVSAYVALTRFSGKIMPNIISATGLK